MSEGPELKLAQPELLINFTKAAAWVAYMVAMPSWHIMTYHGSPHCIMKGD